MKEFSRHLYAMERKIGKRDMLHNNPSPFLSPSLSLFPSALFLSLFIQCPFPSPSSLSLVVKMVQCSPSLADLGSPCLPIQENLAIFQTTLSHYQFRK